VNTTKNGTEHPQAPWKVSVGSKRRREEVGESTPTAKVPKISAAEAMEAEPTIQTPMWEEEEDF